MVVKSNFSLEVVVSGAQLRQKNNYGDCKIKQVHSCTQPKGATSIQKELDIC